MTRPPLFARAALFVAALLLAAASLGGPTLAQTPAVASAGTIRPASHTGALTAALALARLCVNESGLRAYRRDDCAAISAVIDWRREHVPAYRGDTYVEALHRYSGRVVVERRGRGRPWIVDLWPDAREPVAYCPTCSWSRAGRREWRRTYQHASDVLNGDVRAACFSAAEDAPIMLAPHTWARSDVHPAESAERIDCGDTINDFWIVHRYVARFGVM